MKDLTKWMFVFAITTMLNVTSAQNVETFGEEVDWHWEYVVGYLTSSSIGSVTDKSTGNPNAIDLEANGGLLLGARYCGDSDKTGIEYSLLVAFSELDTSSNGDQVLDASGDDLTFLIGDVNWLWYFGDKDEFGKGLIRPFATVGGGLGYIDSDYEYADAELLYNFNAGLGCKFYINQSKTRMVRVDWRWHVSEDFSSTYDDMYQQEISAGIHYAF